MKKGKLIFVTGGARSGKSSFAEKLAFKAAKDRFYIATLQGLDEEMKDRIARHKSQRLGKNWKTVEEPLDILNALKRVDRKKRAVLIDCLTLWISNMMMKNYKEKEIILAAETIAEQARRGQAKVIVVSNEVGMGLVPESGLGRDFRDIQGRVNQVFALRARKVYFTVAGIPLELK